MTSKPDTIRVSARIRETRLYDVPAGLLEEDVEIWVANHAADYVKLAGEYSTGYLVIQNLSVYEDDPEDGWRWRELPALTFEEDEDRS